MSRHEENNKIRRVDWNTALNFDDTEYLCFNLTARQALLLLAQTEYFGWRTRYENLPENEDIDAIRAEIDFRLMNPVGCETMFELRMNGCDLEFSTNGGETWTLVTNWDLSACIASDTTIIDLGTTIVNLETTVINQGDDITNIENNITNINTETTLINQNIQNIVEGVGGVVCLGVHIVMSSGENNISFDIPDGIQWAWIDYTARRNSGAAPTALLAALNDDSTNGNYDSVAALNNRQIANITGSAGDSSSVGKILIHNPKIDGEHKVLSNSGVLQSSAASSVVAMSGNALIWKNDDIVDSIKLSVGDGFLAGSLFRLYGVACTDIELDETPEISWTIEFDFLFDDYDEIVSQNDDGSFDSGNGYVSSLGTPESVDLSFDLLASVNIVRIEADYFIASPDDCLASMSLIEPQTFNLVENQAYPNDTDTMIGMINQTSQFWRIGIGFSGGFSVSRMQWQAVRFSGTGTIPPALTPYQI